MSRPLFVSYGEYRVGAILGDGAVHDVCGSLHGEVLHDADHARTCLPAAIRDWAAIASGVEREPGIAVAEAGLLAPIPRPVNVFGAPVNYLAHQGELGADRSPAKGTVRELGLFVKAAGSVSGPRDAIELPIMPGREFHYEGEIAVVIGEGGEDLDDAGAEAAIAGFTGALDVTLRLETEHREERSMRKSYRTFTPTGPAVLPYRRELLDTLGLELLVNGDRRQHGTLADLVLGVIGLVRLASSIVRLEPGDLILTGTPEGVGRIVDGDRVELRVDGLPALQLDVADRRSAS
ncbi:MAG TPA: fumarylacetoacetate hydrolase family protein [Pseudolysinimonas sp.]|nr:fumarylacetoacetate hydrolase family protein [Pseudolysinimonas sp.]